MRVRLTRIDDLDLKLFEFDHDLTFAVFFLDADEKVYARYGGRDGTGPDERQSLDGLRHTMSSVLAMHARKERLYAPREEGPPRTIRQFARRFRRGCFHCHQVKEALNDELRRKGEWTREKAYRYPLPDNLGLFLEVDRGNVVQRVEKGSAAARVGLTRGDVVRRLNGVPVHSQADAQFALDRAPARGKVAVAWERAGKEQTGKLDLAEGWRKGDIGWRPSMQRMIAAARLYGADLTAAEKKALGLAADQLAFRQREEVHSQARAAGIRAGDIILGAEGKQLTRMEASDFREYISREFLVGDKVRIDVLRQGKRLSLTMTLR